MWPDGGLVGAYEYNDAFPFDEAAYQALLRQFAADIADEEGRGQDLLRQTRAADVMHWRVHQRSIYMDMLCKRLRAEVGVACTLAARLRCETPTDSPIRTLSEPLRAASANAVF